MSTDKKELSIRLDELYSEITGRGTEVDKLKQLAPASRILDPDECRAWYRAIGFLANMIDAPAEDATREWITIKTNMDKEDDKSSISRLIQNRLTELGFREKLKDLIRFSRLYQEGGFMFFGVRSSIPQTSLNLHQPLPENITNIAYINVFGPDRVTLYDKNTSPLSASYHIPGIQIDGHEVHESRYAWLCPSYVAEDGRGVNVLETVLPAIVAQDTALHAVSSMLLEAGAKIFKTSKVDEVSDPANMRNLLRKIVSMLTSQSMISISDDEDITRLETNLNATGLKDTFQFIFENMAGMARLPKSRLSGQAQGTITSGQFDLRSYYDDIARDQENDHRPIIEKAIKLIIREQNGEIYRRLNGQVGSLDWEFEFNPLWKLNEKEDAEIKLIKARTADIWITRGVLSPSDARDENFPDLEQFSGWTDGSSLNFGEPKKIEETENKDIENHSEENATDKTDAPAL
ncbi:TIGR01555 family protein [Leptospira interrogans serovar Bataviae str. HAI135]|nr:TIGR01555 family protein [Leptospira interrogans serovar Bataviae str. HAI135]